MSALRLLLLPFSWIYAGVLKLRHLAYDRGWLTSSTVPLPTVVIGNVALGGTGKTPHVELVLDLLADLGPLATLSRGYGRDGNTSREVHREDDAGLVGDEPLMVKRKHPAVRVFVSADRVAGIGAIIRTAPEVRAVILDDAFQHRKLKAGLNIVLTTWQRPWHKDHLLPAGSLRDLPGRTRTASVVVVTKCPSLPSPDAQQRWREELQLLPQQRLFFSGLRYAPPRSLHDPTFPVPVGEAASAFLVTGIADATALATHVRSVFGTVQHMAFPDHHRFTGADQLRIASRFATFAGPRKTLITTEKDAARLGSALLSGPMEDLPIAVIGVKAEILNDPNTFAAILRNHVATHPTHR